MGSELEAQTGEQRQLRAKPQIYRLRNRPKLIAQSGDSDVMIDISDYEDIDSCFSVMINQLQYYLSILRNTPHCRKTLRTFLNYVRAYRQCTQAVQILAQVEPCPLIRVDSSLNLMAQSGDENSDQTTYQQKLTTFVEDSEIHDSVPDSSDPHFRSYPPPSMAVDLENFIKRPYPIAKFSWLSTQAKGSQIYLYNDATNHDPLYIPDCYNSILFCKLKHIQYWRPTFELEVRVNGTNFHYGRLMFAVYPIPAVNDPVYENYYNASTWKWFQVNPSAHQTVKFVLPYVHYLKKQSLTDNGENLKKLRQMWGIRCFVTVPLSSAQQLNVAPVEVVLWLRVINPNFSSYTFDGPNLAAQSGDGQLFAQGEEEDAQQGKIITDNEKFPPLMNIDLNAVDSIVTKIANMCKSGMSIPPTLEAIKSVQDKNIMTARVDDTPNTRVLGASQTARLQHTYMDVNGCPNETNIVKFCSHPSLIFVGRITAQQTPGTMVYKLPISPLSLTYTDYSFVPEPGTYWPTPLGYTARLFKYWRGSLKIHFSFVASSFHSMKLRIAWVPKPGDTLNYPATLDLEQTSNILNELVDINKQTEYSFIIPWDSNFDFLDMDSSQTGQFTNGCLYLQVVNTLTSSFDTPIPIYFQVFVSCAEDFQFAGPRTSHTAVYGVPDYDSPVPTPTVKKLYAQSGDTGDCELPSSSYKCLKRVKYKPFGGMSRPYRLGRIAMSYEITDFKQLANMLTLIDEQHMDAATGVAYDVTPMGSWKRSANDHMWDSYLPHILAVFRFWSGSVRFAVIPRGGALNQWRCTLKLGYSQLNDSFYRTPDEIFHFSAEGEYLGLNSLVKATHDPIDITIPYYAPVSCVPINSTMRLPGVTVPTMNMIIANGEVEQVLNVYMAAGDDVIFGYQGGIPRCRLPTTAKNIALETTKITLNNYYFWYILKGKDIKTDPGLWYHIIGDNLKSIPNPWTDKASAKHGITYGFYKDNFKMWDWNEARDEGVIITDSDMIYPHLLKTLKTLKIWNDTKVDMSQLNTNINVP